MIRLIAVENDAQALANSCADQPTKTVKTWLVDLPEVEAWLTDPCKKRSYIERAFVGIEIVDVPEVPMPEEAVQGSVVGKPSLP